MTFSSAEPLLNIVEQQKMGISTGAYSICSSNPWVIKACMQQALQKDQHIIVESTSNQVNQFGGYSGMTPRQFSLFLQDLATQVKFPLERIILGADHLGPVPWTNETFDCALERSKKLISDVIQAGYVKVHIDTSMRCNDDEEYLDPEVIAERTADLIEIAETQVDVNRKPVYVIGTEVPVPGGERYTKHEIIVTNSDEAKNTLDLFRSTFIAHGLEEAWKRVVALVVQPGVDFNNTAIREYNRSEAKPLSSMIETVPGIVFEAHSTDYQRSVNLQALVEDHFAFLKVGPALTFAFREAIVSLATIENELLGSTGSQLLDVIERVMLEKPSYWKGYTEDSQTKRLSLLFGFSDRIRYYWPHPEIQAALAQMLRNLSEKPIVLTLISQYFPDLYWEVREGLLENDPISIINHKIQSVSTQYYRACYSKNSDVAV